MTSNLFAKRSLALTASISALVLLAACSGAGSAPSSSDTWRTAASVSAGGGWDRLVAAAKREGQLNLMSLPRDWVNYGALFDTFTRKYGIKVVVNSPDAPSQQELNAIQNLKSGARAPDAVDLGSLALANSGVQSKLFTPYKVQTWESIPAERKAADGMWVEGYGGYMAIGYNADVVKTPPTSFADLAKPVYRNQIGIAGGDPTAAGNAFGTVYSAALASGGSVDDIKPGIAYFANLKRIGNFVPINAQPATIQNGQTPIALNWDFNQATYVTKFQGTFTWKYVIPTDGTIGQSYVQAVSAYAPHPAAARLWEEFLYSDEGQNLWLKGHARPVRMDSMVAAHTIDTAAAAELPPVPGNAAMPSAEQQTQAKKVVSDQWAKVMG